MTLQDYYVVDFARFYNKKREPITKILKEGKNNDCYSHCAQEMRIELSYKSRQEVYDGLIKRLPVKYRKKLKRAFDNGKITLK